MNKTFLKNLLQAPSPSGYEEHATKIVKEAKKRLIFSKKHHLTL